MWGKLGNWPGQISIIGAQALIQTMSLFKPGAQIVQLGFDGGRATIVAGWAASSNGHKITVVGQPAPDQSTEIWYNRAVHLWSMRTFCERSYESEPFECDMIIGNRYDEFIEEWSSYLRIGGAFCLLGAASSAPFDDQDFTKSVGVAGQIAIWTRNVNNKRATPKPHNLIVLPDRAHGNGRALGAFEGVAMPADDTDDAPIAAEVE